MYILAGKHKGKRLKSPRGTQTRPTTSLVRKALFDIVQHEVPGSTVLDLFAGIGSIGLEALSRGARHVTFVEKSPLALRSLNDNIHHLGLTKNEATVLKGDVFTVLLKLNKQKKSYSLIYLDPPYEHSVTLMPEILKAIDQSSLLQEEGLLFLEERKGEGFSLEALHLKHLNLVQTRRYGITELHQFQWVQT